MAVVQASEAIIFFFFNFALGQGAPMPDSFCYSVVPLPVIGEQQSTSRQALIAVRRFKYY